MLEKIITSKTRVKLLKLFLTHIDARYYLRELERMLDESLSPLRRQLLKLTKMGILLIEEEANLKYYRLNKNFAGIKELRDLVLDKKEVTPTPVSYTFTQKEIPLITQQVQGVSTKKEIRVEPSKERSLQPTAKRMRYDIMLLSVISFFVLLASTFVVYTSNKNIKEVTSLVSEKLVESPVVVSFKEAKPTRPDEMVSGKWKLLPGNVPTLSTGEMGGEKKTKEL